MNKGGDNLNENELKELFELIDDKINEAENCEDVEISEEFLKRIHKWIRTRKNLY